MIRCKWLKNTIRRDRVMYVTGETGVIIIVIIISQNTKYNKQTHSDVDTPSHYIQSYHLCVTPFPSSHPQAASDIVMIRSHDNRWYSTLLFRADPLMIQHCFIVFDLLLLVKFVTWFVLVFRIKCGSQGCTLLYFFLSVYCLLSKIIWAAIFLAIGGTRMMEFFFALFKCKKVTTPKCWIWTFECKAWVCSFSWNLDNFHLNTKKHGSSGVTESEVWIGNFNVKAR